GRSLLSIAAAVGATDIVKLLLNRFKDIDVNSQDLTQLTPLHLASYTNRPSAPELLTHLLQHPRIDPTITNDFGQTPLHTAASHNRHALVAKALIKHPRANVNGANAQGWTPLNLAIMSGEADVVKRLL
ncbi:ankyrin, partial [Choiromyces venosus 120613-1]